MGKLVSTETIFLFVLFVLGEFFGNVFNLYRTLVAWDIVTHFVGGALVSSIVISFLHEYLKKYYYAVNVAITLGVGTAREIIEFLADKMFGLGLQPSLNDTMVDLIMVFSAAVIINLIFWYRKRGSK